MAKLYISEYSEMALWGGSRLPMPREPATVVHTPLAIGGASVQSDVFDATTRFVRVSTDSICSIRFGSNPAASTNDMRLAADQVEYFGVGPGDRLAVIANT